MFGQIGTMIPNDFLPDTLADGKLPWQKAGYDNMLVAYDTLDINKIFNVVTDMDTISGNTLDQKISTIITNSGYSSDNIMFYFPAGEYEMHNTIEINRSNIIFKGTGSEFTILKFVKPWDMVDDDTTRHYDFLKIKGSYNNVVTNVGIEDLKIVRENLSNSVQELTESYTGMFVRYNYAQNCWVHGVEFDDAGRSHIYITNSNNLEFKGCYFHHGIDYGEGGNGYGIQIGEYSNKCLIENNVFGRLRHAIVLSDEAHHNVIAYNSMDEQHSEYPFIIDPFEWVISDMCIHGHNDNFDGDGPYENLFEGNCGSWVRIDKVHGSNGPKNLIFRNIADEVGIEICGGNDDQVIVNNYFKCSNTAVTTFWDVPWASSWLDPPQNTYFKNNKCKRNDLTGWHIYWKPCYDPSYYNDVSYYKDSIPDFITEDKWPFDPVNQINPAEERRDNSWGITLFSDFTNYIITDPNYIFLESYFYSWNNPTNSNDSNNELFFIYHNCSTQSPVVTYSLEKEDGTLIVDNQSTSKHTSNFNDRAFPLSCYYKRKMIQDYEGPITIKNL